MTAGIQQKAGAEPMGTTPNPQEVVTASDFDTKHRNYRGKSGIDGLYSRPNPAQVAGKQRIAAESKTTGNPNAGAPIGKGQLATLKGGIDQLSNRWIEGNLANAGISPEDRAEFSQALREGKVLKVYAQTTPKGTRYFKVIDLSETTVEIGEEITSFDSAFDALKKGQQ
jgi:hypothetical protein